MVSFAQLAGPSLGRPPPAASRTPVALRTQAGPQGHLGKERDVPAGHTQELAIILQVQPARAADEQRWLLPCSHHLKPDFLPPRRQQNRCDLIGSMF